MESMKFTGFISNISAKVDSQDNLLQKLTLYISDGSFNELAVFLKEPIEIEIRIKDKTIGGIAA